MDPPAHACCEGQWKRKSDAKMCAAIKMLVQHLLVFLLPPGSLVRLKVDEVFVAVHTLGDVEAATWRRRISVASSTDFSPGAKRAHSGCPSRRLGPGGNGQVVVGEFFSIEQNPPTFEIVAGGRTRAAGGFVVPEDVPNGIGHFTRGERAVATW